MIKTTFRDKELELDPNLEFSFLYKNWKGEVSLRRVIAVKLELTSTEWHQEKQFILFAYDLDKQDIRGFAIADILEQDALGKAAYENK